jgi:hypothetical protein
LSKNGRIAVWPVSAARGYDFFTMLFGDGGAGAFFVDRQLARTTE